MQNHQLFSRIFVFGLAVIPVLAMELPRILGFYPSLLGIIMSAWWVFGLKEKLVLSRLYFVVTGIISILIITSSIWSISPAEAFEKSIFLSFLLLSGGLFVSLAQNVGQQRLRPYLIALPIGMIIAALLCSIELYFELPLYQIFHSNDVRGNTSVMNRGIITFSLCFFPVLSIIPLLEIGKIKKYSLYTAFFLSMILMMKLTQSQSAQMGLIAGFIVFLAFPYKRDWAYPVLAGGISVAMLLTPLIVVLMFYYGIGGFAEQAWLREGYAAHRLEIWEFVIRYAMHNPLYGFGLEATRFVPAFEHGYIIHKQPTVLHPHNFSVQIWMEFGAIGVTLACTLLTAIIYAIRSMPARDARYGITVLITIISVSAASYGIWQGWWIGVIIFTIALFFAIRDDVTKTEKCMSMHQK